MEPINEKDLLESVEKAAFEGAKAGAKEGRKTSIVAKAGGKLASKILAVLLVIVVAMALFPKINVMYKIKQELGFDKNVSGYDLTLDNNGIFGYTAADFAEVVLGDASKLKKIEVYEREVTDVATITDAGLLKIKLFSKSQEIKYSGVATYVVDMSYLGKNSFSVDEREHVVTMKIPHAELKDLNVKKVEIAEVKKGTLAFGKIKLSAEDSDKVDKEVEKKMLKKLENENEAEKADEFAQTVIWDMFYPQIAKVSPGYSLEIEFK
ncbi:MAG: DUF4230 domain-containing protein [Bacillota bacterium]|nr:DUF4230 domain-containing protein [Bacillota bacterium]